MNGVMMMLKSMGLDPDRMKADVEGFVKRLDERFDSIERRLTDLERSNRRLQTEVFAVPEPSVEDVL